MVKVPLTTLHKAAVAHVEGLSNRQIDMMKNFFALGLSYWIFDRPIEPTIRMLEKKFQGKDEIIDGNVSTLKAGYNFGETVEEFQIQYQVKKAVVAPGTYRAITGTQATAIGMVTAAHKAGKTLFYGSYPITPASAVLEELAALKNFDVRTFQAEDEISALGSVIGAAFGGAFAATGTSGPGIALKSEAMNLALMMELPLVICDFQRGGPSTGMPTKTEQSDLLQCMFGRNGDSPIPIVSPATPSDCFDMIIEAFRIAVETMSPVIFLSDGYLNTSAEPWKIPDPDEIPTIQIEHRTDPEDFLPYLRDPKTLARPWVLPGTPGLEHRLGGLGKEDGTGNVSYDPDDNQHMANIRAERLTRIADRIPLQHVMGPKSGDLLVLGWGCTYGAIRSECVECDSRAIRLPQRICATSTHSPKIWVQYCRVTKPYSCPNSTWDNCLCCSKPDIPHRSSFPTIKFRDCLSKFQNSPAKLPKYWALPRPKGIQTWQTLLKH